MSNEAVDWAHSGAPWLLTEKGKPDTTARQVLVALADRAHADGSNSFPSVLRLHFMTGLDKRTITRALERLVLGGLIEHVSTMPSGNKNWTLQLSVTRSATEWEDLKAADEKAKRVDSERRQARRIKEAAERVSGTQSTGHPVDNSCDSWGSGGDVRDAEYRRRDSASRTPGFSVPASGTQSTDVRDAAPPEPYLEPSLNRPGTVRGATLPPDPLRGSTPSAHFNETVTSSTEVVNDQTDLGTQLTTRAPAENSETIRRKPALRLITAEHDPFEECPHGLPLPEWPHLDHRKADCVHCVRQEFRQRAAVP